MKNLNDPTYADREEKERETEVVKFAVKEIIHYLNLFYDYILQVTH